MKQLLHIILFFIRGPLTKFEKFSFTHKRMNSIGRKTALAQKVKCLLYIDRIGSDFERCLPRTSTSVSLLYCEETTGDADAYKVMKI
jgi:hypothetical protein